MRLVNSEAQDGYFRDRDGAKDVMLLSVFIIVLAAVGAILAMIAGATWVGKEAFDAAKLGTGIKEVLYGLTGIIVALGVYWGADAANSAFHKPVPPTLSEEIIDAAGQSGAK